MIPIRDVLPTRRFPLVNTMLIVINVLVYFFISSLGPLEERVVYRLALIPFHFVTRMSIGDVSDIFTSMFMHAGLMHLGGNMLYLWIFGDNVEDRMGRGRYLLFYLLGGTVASLAHILTNPFSRVPTVGASGAIAAVLGAYLVLYPQSRVLTLVPLGFFLELTTLPASLVLGVWFLLQFFSGILSLGGPDVGGVAFWAHIGGFVAGVLLARPFARREPPQILYW